MPEELRLDLLADSRLPSGLLFLPEGGRPVKQGPARQVLLTGATGFVGGFVLKELLNRVDKVGRLAVRYSPLRQKHVRPLWGPSHQAADVGAGWLLLPLHTGPLRRPRQLA
jgi:hypothetical protein